MDKGDISFVLVSAALVLLMTPGLALFYGGMVRTKNVLGTIMQSFIIIALITVEWRMSGKATTLGAASGAIAGLLATITPAAGFVGPLWAALIGVLAGVGCYFGILAKNRFGYDDSLDVVGIHGVGGVIGLLAAGLFASMAINPGGADGLFYGNPSQLGMQAFAVVVTIVYAFAVSYVLLKMIDKLFGLRVSERDEINGLDLSEHEETAYNF